MFIEKAHAIIKKRSEFVASVNTLLAELFARIAGRPERWKLRFHSSLQGDTRQDAQTLARDREIQAGDALYGPHRDDFPFEFAGRQREALFSQGEFRISLLALNEPLVARAGFRPVIILDDLYANRMHRWEREGDRNPARHDQSDIHHYDPNPGRSAAAGCADHGDP